MPHAREQIRTAVVTNLTGLATTGSAVHNSRVYAFETLPCLNIATPFDEKKDDVMNGIVNRTVDIVVEGRVRESAAAHNTLDDIAAEVEAAMFADPGIGGRVKYLELANTDISFEEGSQNLVGLVRLTFRAEYRVAETDPTTIVQ